ncbi:hypothetical protein AAFF_G00209800 [Aldrovandia affinis]|uniref:DDE Tnp4 domain-containing protein n=1 Tax=Aldrovandia affinis TaxID=143900 RepID=A0AAD7SW68_9TELE|nr:hypothetical protein AAFF_G00209800 [Aldrovandia affinis]
MRGMDPKKHFQYFRMTNDHFDRLVRRLGPATHQRTTNIDTAQRLAVTLQLLASGGTQQSIVASNKLGNSTLSSLYRSVDGKHVVMKAPPNSGSDFINYKGHHSIVLMAYCDGGVYQDSQFGGGLLQGKLDIPPPANLPGTGATVPHVLVDNAAFPLHVPTLTTTERSTTTAILGPVIENTFGILAARWRILGHSLEFRPDKAVDVVKACIALHNFLACTDAANKPNTRYIPPNFTDSPSASGEPQPGEWRRQVAGDRNLLTPRRLSACSARATQDAFAVRNDLMGFFQSPCNNQERLTKLNTGTTDIDTLS